MNNIYLNKSIVNVLGLQRSGTSMLSAMLANGTGIVSVGEIVAYYRITQYRRDEPPPESFPFAAEVPAHSFHKEALNRIGAHTIIDSSKSLEWALEVNNWYQGSKINVYNVLIWKDPEDYLFSQWKRGIRDTLSPRYYKWPYYHRRLLRSGAEFVSLNYKELVQKPEKQLAILCDHIGLESFKGKEKFWEGKSRLAGSSPGVKSQIRRGVSKISREKWPSEYENIAKRVRLFAEKDKRVKNVIESIEKKDVGSVNTGSIEGGHKFRPLLLYRIEQIILNYVKTFVMRLRWNTIHRLIGWEVHKQILKYITPDIERRSDSFDPGDDKKST